MSGTSKICIPKQVLQKYGEKYNVDTEEIENLCKVWVNKGNIITPETSTELENYLEDNLKIVSSNFYENTKDYNNARNVWKRFKIKFRPSSKQVVETYYEEAKKYFDPSQIKIYRNKEGKYAINIAEPKQGTPINKKETKEVKVSDAFKEAEELLNEIIAFSKQNVRKGKNFEKDHIYEIKKGDKWVNADISVTKLVKGDKTMPLEWSIPSSYIGTLTDSFVRDFFEKGEEDIKSPLTAIQSEALKEDLRKLKKTFDEKFGEGQYKVITKEIPIVSNYIERVGNKNVVKTIAGTMDMIVFDSKGNFYIYDMKTMRSDPRSEKLLVYFKQLSYYKNMLETQFPQIKGKVKDLNLIRIDVQYPAPPCKQNNYNGAIYDIDEQGHLQILDETTETFVNIENYKLFSSPRLHQGSDSDWFIQVPTQDTKKLKQYKNEEKESDNLSQLLGKMKKEEKEKEFKENSFNKKERERKKKAWRDSTLLSASEKHYLSNLVMNLTSQLITRLNTSKAEKDIILADSNGLNKFGPDIDFTKMSRMEIIETVGLKNLFDKVKEIFFDPSIMVAMGVDFDRIEAVHLINDNFDALIEDGYAKMILLENYSIVRLKADEFVVTEGYDDQMSEDNDPGQLEEREREYYQLGQRQISAKAGLSTEIRRLFERLELPTKDPTWQLPRFVDSSLAVNSILDWCRNCETMAEMEEVLNDKLPTNTWLAPILAEIKKEPVRSMFFNNFRKDFTQYSINYIDYDSKGKMIIKSKVINTKDASQTALDGIVASFKEGMVSNLIKTKDDLEGRGYVIKSELEEIKKLHKELYSNFHLAHRAVKGYPKAVRLNSKKFANLLSRIGINIGETPIIDTIKQDGNKKNWSGTKTYAILEKVGYIIEELEKHTSKTEMWNPIIKDSDQKNSYGDYASIVKILSDSLQSSIESSTYQGGKMYYSFVVPSYMGRLIKDLKDAYHGENNNDKFKEFLKNNYKYDSFFYNSALKDKKSKWLNRWLHRLENESEARQILDHKVQLTHLDTEYTELSELGYAMSLITEFMNNGSKNVAWYRLPILSNKPSSEFIRFYKDTSSKYQKNLIEGFKDVALQEIIRIQSVLEDSGKSDITNYHIKSEDAELFQLAQKYQKNQPLTHDDIVKEGKLIFTTTLNANGASFKFLDFLNNHLVDNTELGKIILDKINGKEVNEATFSKEFELEFKKWMESKVTEEIANYEKLGLFDTIGKNGDVKFKYAFSLHKTSWKQAYDEALKQTKNKTEAYTIAKNRLREEIEDNLRKYIWNDSFATIEIIQLTATDLAYYENMNDFQKRFAQVHSPGMRLNIDAKMSNGKLYSDGYCRTINIADFNIMSETVANVLKIFDDIIAQHTDKNIQIALRAMQKDIVKEFSKIKKITDGQAYSCPTSYRKKLAMMGKWDDAMEEAYNRICKGNFNIDDLNVIWQPLKPFVYTQVNKTTESSKRPNQKVPMQFKNSEYLILLTDAIMRGAKKDNLLSSIFDFMESTHYSSDEHNISTYKPDGIDTVQFASAVKSGLMGVIDIREVDNVKEFLTNTINSDPNKYVHTLSYLDYAIQQEVPAHLLDHKQLMGSQSRILSISDFSPSALKQKLGKLEITTEEAIQEYQNLIAENIRESYNLLIEELNLKGSRKEKNEALAELLYETISKDQRYGGDLLYACQIDPDSPNSEFILPINDPIQSIRVQQLLNSIIKSRINKQEVSGGPVVQATANGLSEKLNIRFKDKNGNILLTYREFCQSNNLIYEPNKISESYKLFSDYVVKNQGSFAYFECLLSVPNSELKEALLIKKGDKRFNKNRVGSLMTVEEALKYKVINEEMLEAIGYRIPTEDKYSILPMKIVGFTTSTEETIILPEEITLITGADFDIDKIYVMLKSFKKTKTGFVRDDKGREKRNNRIFDIQYELLRHPDTMQKMFNPGSFDVQKKAARIVTILEQNPKETYEHLSQLSLDELNELVGNDTSKNIIFPSSQIYYHRQNMVAAKLIGIFANNNTSHAFISMQNIGLNYIEGDGFTFDGVKIESGTKLDNIIAQNGYTLISKTIAGFLAASVDAVKDPVLNFMNLNPFTAGVAMTLARLGFDTDSIALFLTQPAIKEVTREYFKRNEDEYVSAEELINEYLLNEFDLDDTEITSKEEALKHATFTKEELAKNITSKEVFTEEQIDALLLFKRLAGIATNLNILTFLTKFNSVTNAVGPSIADTLVMEERYLKFLDTMDGPEAPFTLEAVDVIDNSPILKAFYETTVDSSSGLSRKIFEEYFPQYNEVFDNVRDLARRYTKSSLDSKTINKLVDFFTLYKASMSNFLLGDFETLEEAKKYYILEFPKKFHDMAQKYVDSNELIKIISYESKTKRCPVATLQAKTGGYSVDVQERIKTAWTELLKSSDPEARKLGKDLFIYNIYRNGFSFSPKTFLHLASTDVKLLMNIENEDELLRYCDIIDSSDPLDLESGIDTFNLLLQFMRNNYHNRKLVPELQKHKKLIIKEDTDLDDNHIITITFNKQKQGVSNIITDTEGGANFFAPVILYKETLYMRDDNSPVRGNKVTYTETTPLGIANNFIEVDGSAKSASNVRTIFTNTDLSESSKSGDKNSASNNTNNDVEVISALKESKRAIREFTATRANSETIQQLVDADDSTESLSQAQIAIIEKVASGETVNKYKRKFKELQEKYNKCKQ